MSFYEWRPYVSVAERRRQAERELAKLRKKGQSIFPVKIEGRAIAASFWGKSWCENLERYSDYASRLPRGRTYVRNGSVVHLEIAKGEVQAIVSGSELYKAKVTIAPVAKAHWRGVCRDCAGAIDSMVELLQGRLAKAVMERVCRQGDGLFPAPKEIKLSCSCPDWADMCKHVAAVLYGVGARLDVEPQLLFVLRGVDENELIAHAGRDLSLIKSAPGAAKLLDDGDVAALFGLEMAEPDVAVAAKLEPPSRATVKTGRKGRAAKQRSETKDSAPPRRGRAKIARASKSKRKRLTRSA